VEFNDDLWFHSVGEVVDGNFQYRNSAYMAIAFDSTEFEGNIPSRTYLVKGRRIKVPSNFNPETGVYTGDWDGTFTTRYSNDPAWVLYDILTADDVLGPYIDPANLNRYDFQTISEYNNAQVDDGKGGTEKRYTFNGVINGDNNAFDIITNVASVMRCQVYWAGGGIHLVQDKPAEIKALAVRSNVIDGNYDYGNQVEQDQLSSSVAVYWRNEDDNWQSVAEVVEDTDLLEKTNLNPASYRWPGITSRGQARRLAKFLLEDQDKDGLTYIAGLDHNAVQPGDIILQHDSDFTTVDYSGRLTEPRGVARTDRIIAQKTYNTNEIPANSTISVIVNGKVETRTISRYNLTSFNETRIFLTTGFSQQPQHCCPYIIETPSLKHRRWWVESVRQNNSQYQIRCREYDSTRYSRIEENLDFEDYEYSDTPSGPLSAPSNLNIIESNPEGIPTVLINWQNTDTRVKQYEIDIQGVDKVIRDTVSNTEYEISNVVSGDYVIRIRSIDSVGRYSIWVTSNQTFTGDSPVLSTPSVTVSTDSNTLSTILSWQDVDDSLPVYYDIYYGTTQIFDDADIIATTQDLQYIVTKSGYYYIVARYRESVSPNSSNHITVSDFPKVSKNIFSSNLVSEFNNAVSNASQAVTNVSTLSNTVDNVESNVSILQGAFTNSDGDQARLIFNAATANASSFLSIGAQNSSGNSYSNVGIGADSVSIYNPSGNSYVPVLTVENNAVQISGTLASNGQISLGSSSSGTWPLALQQRQYSVQDGSNINYGTIFPSTVTVDHTIIPQTLELGEARNFILSTTGNASGFTASLKRRKDGVPVRRVDSTIASSPSGVNIQIRKGHSDLAHNQIYTFIMRGTIALTYAGTPGVVGPNDYTGSGSLTFHFHGGGSTWSNGGATTFDGNSLGVNARHTSGTQTYQFEHHHPVTWAHSIRLDKTQGSFGISWSGGQVTVTDFDVEYYTASPDITETAPGNAVVIVSPRFT